MRAAVALLMLCASAVFAQRSGGYVSGGPGRYGWGPWGAPELGDPDSYFSPPGWHGNPKYDGHFTFARIKYKGFGRWSGREGPGWSHDYPDADSHFTRILRSITTMHPFIEDGPIIGATILAFDDPQLSKYPVAYLSEPAAWHPSDSEIVGLRNYLAKGGFVVFDDFRIESRWDDSVAFVQTMAKVLPQSKIMSLPLTHVIFDSFFKIDFDLLRQSRLANEGSFWAIYKDNDPTKRIMAVINFDQDIGDFWQWSPRGFNVVPTNEAYKLGVNYMIYALTH